VQREHAPAIAYVKSDDDVSVLGHGLHRGIAHGCRRKKAAPTQRSDATTFDGTQNRRSATRLAIRRILYTSERLRDLCEWTSLVEANCVKVR
jgi:hypothetical protein